MNTTKTPVRYEVVRPGSGWTASGPTPDRCLSNHRTEDLARRAFDKGWGPRVLMAVYADGSRLPLDRAIA